MRRMRLTKADNKKTFHDAFTEFILYSRAKNLSNATLDFYEESYKQFVEFIGEGKCCRDITAKTIDEYILKLKNSENISDVTINTRLRGCRAILKYMMKLEYIEQFTIHMIKVDKPLKVAYTDAELKILLEKPNIHRCDFAEYRNWVIINTLLSTGIRASTLCKLKVNDVDFENGVMYLKHMKGRRQKTIPLGSILRDVLMEYLQFRQHENPDDYLFIGVYGNKLSTNSLGWAIRKYHHKRGVMKTGLHLYRHTFAKKYLDHGGNLFYLQDLLAHRSIETTRGYISLFTEDLKVDYDDLNPLKDFAPKKKSYIKMRGK